MSPLHDLLPQNLPSPQGLDLNALRHLLQSEIYGILPPAPDRVWIEAETILPDTCAGKALCKELTVSSSGDFGIFSFPIRIAIPKSENPLPCLLLINFRPDFPDRYLPVEELIDGGFAVCSFYYQDITADNDDFGSLLAPLLLPNGQNSDTACGKIALWAWAAIRVNDLLRTQAEIDPDRITVVGHSRLGKTALFAGAMDERFFCAISNDSGCGGASLARGNTGETIRDICRNFPYWFCIGYRRYIDREEDLPLDQHYLLCANRSHPVYVASAEGDAWACPKNEFLSCVAASDYAKANGDAGLLPTPSELPKAGDFFHDGSIGYHIRGGTHYLSREDWGRYMQYLRKHF